MPTSKSDKIFWWTVPTQTEAEKIINRLAIIFLNLTDYISIHYQFSCESYLC